MKRLILFTAVFSLLLTSCVDFREIDIKNVKLEKFKLINTSSANVFFKYEIDNSTNSSLILLSADGFITKKGVNFAQLQLMKPDTIHSHSLSSRKVGIQLDLLDPVSLLSMGLNISSWNVKDFNMNARIVVKTSSGYKKVFKLKNVPLEKVVNRL